MSSLLLAHLPSPLTQALNIYYTWTGGVKRHHGRESANPGTGRGRKMPGMRRPQSQNHAAYKDATEVSRPR